ncbi:hypothetical protein PI2015_1287 [Pseudoalteromonas issachenkonii]|nr:hypothetical protein [Pseudoalteromonas issachenkonii]ALQ54595.1 hypothetical protein PI2015_1287 [Pseudoalteromonas issachenkonii]
MNPCQRKTLDLFTDRCEFISREPQYFGMVCLHGFNVKPSLRYWEKYGPFGIEMSPDWVIEKRFQKVRYIERHGRERDRIKAFFDEAIEELDGIVNSQYPEDGFRQMAYTNKIVAGLLGARKWAKFLTLFESMEPYENSYEREWRFSRPDPLYNNDPIPKVVDNLNNDRGWSRHIYPLKFSDSDVLKVHVSRDCVKELQEMLNDMQSDLKISTALNKLLSAEKLLATLPIFRRAKR